VLIAIEQRHVVHHIAELRRCGSTATATAASDGVPTPEVAGEIAA